jgi:hypothetical protein
MNREQALKWYKESIQSLRSAEGEMRSAMYCLGFDPRELDEEVQP